MKFLLKNKVIYWSLILIFLSSCTSYIQVMEIKQVPNENAMQSRVFELPGDTLTMQFFGDYRFDKLLKDFILVSNADFKKIINKNIQLGKSQQFTFTYTDMPDLNNVVGLYYTHQTIDGIQKIYPNKPYFSNDNVLMYVFEYNEFTVAEVFKNVEGGVVRFVNVSKQEGERQKNAFIEYEVKELYFVRN
jgi:hypothetical protein